MVGLAVRTTSAWCAVAVVMAGGSWMSAATRSDADQAAPVKVTTAPAPDVARGRYLVERVAMCGECHSSRDQAGEIVPSTRLRGGPLPVKVPWSADWPLQVPRIAGLPAYSDIDAQRLLMEGAIKRDGTRARAPMPRFRMSAEDAAAVVAFLRTQ